MNCPEVRKTLYPSPEKCALTVETSRAWEHLRQCVACQEHFSIQAAWALTLKAKMEPEEIPEWLHCKVLGKIQKAQGPGTRRWFSQSGRRMLIVALLFFSLAGAWFAYFWPSRQLFQSVFEDHARYLEAQSQLNSSNAEDIESWFRDKTDFGVRVPAVDSAQLLGGRLCFLKKRKAALVFYRKGGRTVSLFQFNARGISLAALKQAEIDGSVLWRTSSQGYSLAAFEQRGVLFVVVSDLRESELLNLASAMQVKSHGY